MGVHAVKQDLIDIIQSAVDSAIPNQDWIRYLPEPPKGRVIIVGAGKASAKMAAVVDELWSHIELSGIVSTRYGHGVDAGRIKVIEAGHPVPDENSVIAAKCMLELVGNLSENDLVLALVSGGGSATCALPIEQLTLEQKQEITKKLLKSGASISEMNSVRKALSTIKGGGLMLAAQPAKVHSLIISDIPGDDPKDVASGPTVLTENTASNALDVMKRYNMDSELISMLTAMSQKEDNVHTFKHQPTFDLVATPSQALRVAAQKAEVLGYSTIILSDEIEGESLELGKFLSAIAKSVKKHQFPLTPPAAIISGGESAVTIGSVIPGKGGRNTEFLLSFAHEMKGEQGIFAAAVDSDGIDGSEDAAGALYTPDSLVRAKELGINSVDFLKTHDSYSYFEALDDLIITGPTYTNVNDIRVLLIN